MTSWNACKSPLDTADRGVPIAALLSSALMRDRRAATPLPLSLMSAQHVTNLHDLMDAACRSRPLREHRQSLDPVRWPTDATQAMTGCPRRFVPLDRRVPAGI